MASRGSRVYRTAFTVWEARHESSLPYWPLERVTAIQSRRLSTIVRHAYQEVPFYREAMERLRLRPEDIRTAEDLAHLPVVTSEDVLHAPEAFRPRGLRHEQCLRIDSSGTSGRRKPIHHDATSLFLSLAHGQRQRSVLRPFTGRATSYREMHAARAGGVHHQIRTFYESHSVRLPGVELTRAYLPLVNVTLAQQVELINRFRPTVLRGYGSQLGSLFRRVAGNGLRIERPKVVVYGADRMPSSERRLIEDEFEIPVLSTYQAVEALRIGFQCEERQGFHLFVDDVAVRVVDGEGRDVSPGERGHLLLSNLTNRATVLLNYRLGDIVRSSTRPCACGRTLPTIESIEGRSDDLLLLPSGEEVHSLAVLERLQAVPGIVQVQLVQEDRDRFELRCVPDPGTARAQAAEALVGALSASLGMPARARVRWMERIPPDASGKTKAVVSRCHLESRTAHDDAAPPERSSGAGRLTVPSIHRRA